MIFSYFWNCFKLYLLIVIIKMSNFATLLGKTRVVCSCLKQTKKAFLAFGDITSTVNILLSTSHTSLCAIFNFLTINKC